MNKSTHILNSTIRFFIQVREHCTLSCQTRDRRVGLTESDEGIEPSRESGEGKRWWKRKLKVGRHESETQIQRSLWWAGEL